ncbi:hypothetical protein [Romboutsia lituseburensis]|uniref:hypothetical protein n=1 Tax=Romboutsia lituseburensis TaxID=1537 RepID=UPI00215A951F|nr:hypothetical protein [Romboutsia lituseburensis]MCR8743744.1 hypothetical protein [Romboutsia lituseburensis]
MNNILNLYDIELKRIYKWYLALLSILLVGNIGVVTKHIRNIIMTVASDTKSKESLALMKLQQAKKYLYETHIYNIYESTTLLLGLAVLICLVYALIIWYRDFVGKNKTGYTLFMLPNNKFNVYIAKAITIVVMIFGVMLMQMLFWGVDILILKIVTSIPMKEIFDLAFNTNGVIRNLTLIQPYLIDFIMIDIIGVILAVLVIFTAVMIQKSFKIKTVGIALGIIYVYASIVIFSYIGSITPFSDRNLIGHIIYFIGLFIVSVGLSYTLLNKKVYI